MKFLDRLLRDWRIREAELYIEPHDKVLDIGAFDTTFFEKLLQKPIAFSLGIDPLLEKTISNNNFKLIKGKFPEDIPQGETFNCITMLAVLEHIPSDQQKQLSELCYNCLKSEGKVIITVPSPFVDKILWVLSRLRLVDGMSLEEHYGFKARDTPKLFSSEHFSLVKHKSFQLGLNNLYVFKRTD